jgi:hypothetical protein
MASERCGLRLDLVAHEAGAEETTSKLVVRSEYEFVYHARTCRPSVDTTYNS